MIKCDEVTGQKYEDIAIHKANANYNSTINKPHTFCFPITNSNDVAQMYGPNYNSTTNKARGTG